MSLFAGLATLAGAGLGLIGNAKAASASKSAGDAAASAIRESTATAKGIYDQNYQAGAPGITALQDELKRPTPNPDIGLTPYQQQQLDDLRRRTENSLAGGGFRGSGRARVSAMRAVEGDARNRFMESNRTVNRQERQFAENAKRGVAGTLASGAFGANNASAGASLNEGRSLAGVAENQGNLAANRAIGDAAIGANAIGDLAGAFDPSLRKSRYGTGQVTSAMRSYYGS